jgi:hypothetical protein
MPTVVKVISGYLEVDVGGTGGQPPYPSQGPGFPTHPISPGGQPPSIWGGAPPYVDIGGPGQQPGGPHPSHPIAPGGRPSHPIAPGGSGGEGGQPPGTWGGTPPIYIDIGPPGQQPPQPPEDESKIQWHTGWSSDQGWIVVGIVTPEGPVPTPST